MADTIHKDKFYYTGKAYADGYDRIFNKKKKKVKKPVKEEAKKP